MKEVRTELEDAVSDVETGKLRKINRALETAFNSCHGVVPVYAGILNTLLRASCDQMMKRGREQR